MIKNKIFFIKHQNSFKLAKKALLIGADIDYNDTVLK